VIYLLNPKRWALDSENELVLEVLAGSPPAVHMLPWTFEVESVPSAGALLVALFLLAIGVGAARRRA